jgi:hypothetical protein
MNTQNGTPKDKTPLPAPARATGAGHETMSPAVLPLDLEATSDEVLALLATAVPAEQSRR